MDSIIKTKLKFVKSKTSNSIVSFVSQNPANGRVCGVREDSPYPKKVCVLHSDLASTAILNVLYDAELSPMSNGKSGYIVTKITPVEFRATIETNYVPKCVYTIEVKFGNKVILFDPLAGRKTSVRTIQGCLELLAHRVDIKNLDKVLSDFNEAAQKLCSLMRKDGYYVEG